MLYDIETCSGKVNQQSFGPDALLCCSSMNSSCGSIDGTFSVGVMAQWKEHRVMIGGHPLTSRTRIGRGNIHDRAKRLSLSHPVAVRVKAACFRVDH